MRRYIVTILGCAVAGAAIVLGLDGLQLPFWLYPAALMSVVFIASRLARRRVILADGKVMQAPPHRATSWERQHPTAAATVVGAVTGVVISTFLFVNAPGASLTFVLGVAFGFGFLLGLGTLRAIVAERPSR